MPQYPEETKKRIANILHKLVIGHIKKNGINLDAMPEEQAETLIQELMVQYGETAKELVLKAEDFLR